MEFPRFPRWAMTVKLFHLFSSLLCFQKQKEHWMWYITFIKHDMVHDIQLPVLESLSFETRARKSSSTTRFLRWSVSRPVCQMTTLCFFGVHGRFLVSMLLLKCLIGLFYTAHVHPHSTRVAKNSALFLLDRVNVDLSCRFFFLQSHRSTFPTKLKSWHVNTALKLLMLLTTLILSLPL